MTKLRKVSANPFIGAIFSTRQIVCISSKLVWMPPRVRGERVMFVHSCELNILATVHLPQDTAKSFSDEVVADVKLDGCD